MSVRLRRIWPLLWMACLGCEEGHSLDSDRSQTQRGERSPTVVTGDQLSVQIDASHLAEGDYYGSIRITADFDTVQRVEIPVHAHVADVGVIGGGPTPALATAEEEAETGKWRVDWISPPPATVQAGTNFQVTFQCISLDFRRGEFG